MQCLLRYQITPLILVVLKPHYSWRLGRFCGCWWLGSLRRQVISNIDPTGWKGPYLPRRMILATCAISVLRNNTQWASCQIRKLAGCACAGNAGNVFPRRRLQRKPLVSDSGMHHGTCVTHVPWCMSGSLTRGGGENVSGIPGACAPVILRIW